MPGYVLSTAMPMRIERFNEDHRWLHQIERDTGFVYGGRSQATARHDLRKLSQWLQESGQVVMVAASGKLNLRLISDVLKHMLARPEGCGDVGSAATPARRDNSAMKTTAVMTWLSCRAPSW